MGWVTKNFQFSVSRVVTVWIRQHAMSGNPKKKKNTVSVFLSVLCKKLVAAHSSSH